MFCTKCGKELQDGDKFCSGCGTMVVGATPLSSPTPQTQYPTQLQYQSQPSYACPQQTGRNRVVTVTREKKMGGFLLPVHVYIDGVHCADVYGNSPASFEISLGEHVLSCRHESVTVPEFKIPKMVIAANDGDMAFFIQLDIWLNCIPVRTA